jgi:hypothetical protein
LLKIENIEVIDIRQIDALPPLIVKHEPEETRFRIRLNTLKIPE